MIEIIEKQLSLDYCCSAADVKDNVNHFSEYRPLDGCRRFGE